MKTPLELLDDLSKTLTVPAAEYVPAIPDAWAIIDQLRAALRTEPRPSSSGQAVEARGLPRLPKSSDVCRLCGKGWPHEHPPEDVVIFRNGMKAAHAGVDAEFDIVMSATEPELDRMLRDEGVDPDEAAARGKAAVETAIKRAAAMNTTKGATE